MRSFVLVAAITLIGFVAGGAAGIWYERHLPLALPPPPFQPLSEFRGGPRGGPGGGPGFRQHLDRQELIQRIESLRPQLEKFQQRMTEINAEFDRNLDTVLNPSQRAVHADDMKRHHGPNPNDTRPISDSDISWIFREQMGRTVAWDVVIPFRLDQLIKQYGLDDAQREVVRALLLERRREFLELVDSSPPPTVALSRLAQMMQRLRQPAPPPGPGSGR